MITDMLQHQLFVAIQTASVWEATTRKLGNVHRTADFTDMSYLDFVTSAGTLALSMSKPDPCLGAYIFDAVHSCSSQQSNNINLGITLLFGPIIQSHVYDNSFDTLHERLSASTVADAEQVYAAIRLANPGNMGQSESQDLSTTPTVSLYETMLIAADYDLIASQYTNGFSEILNFGMSHLSQFIDTKLSLEESVIRLQLAFMSSYPDSLIARKFGLPVAIELQQRVAHINSSNPLQSELSRSQLIALDGEMRQRRLNPGTIADLVAATLLVALLQGDLTIHCQRNWAFTESWL